MMLLVSLRRRVKTAKGRARRYYRSQLTAFERILGLRRRFR